jgi:hypothetical protein
MFGPGANAQVANTHDHAPMNSPANRVMLVADRRAVGKGAADEAVRVRRLRLARVRRDTAAAAAAGRGSEVRRD